MGVVGPLAVAVAVVDVLMEAVIGGLGSVLTVEDRGGKEWEGVLIEVAEDGVGRIGEVVVLNECWSWVCKGCRVPR